MWDIAEGTQREVLYYENFNLLDVVTPVKYEKLEQLLIDTKYPEEKTKYVVESFKFGFSIGYAGPREVVQEAPNLKFREVGDEVTLWNKVMKEVNLGRYAGPFSKPPYDKYIQSPIGLVPKDGGRTPD